MTRDPGIGESPAGFGGPSPGEEPSPGEDNPSAADEAALEHWVGELESYFRGERLSWRADELPLDVLFPGAFERSVCEALLSVAAGETVAYGELAYMAGYPRAARAVGNVMATNPVPVVVPCHRVIRADGLMGNYGNDPVWKDRLLSHERSHPVKQQGGSCGG